MFRSFPPNGFAILATVAGLAWALGGTNAAAQMAMQGHNHAGHAMSQHGTGHAADAVPASAAQKAPHGGQVSKTARHTVEVVYQPKETRVYLYDLTGAPRSARGIPGQLAMQVRGNDKVYRFPLAYVATQTGSKDQDYLAATVDVGRIRDGEMTVTFELTGLPQEPEAQTRFTQTFALSRPRLLVTVAQLTQADQAGIARQKVCPVTGGKLGAMGTPVKLPVGDQPIYLCCRGCVAKIQANPELYLQKVTAAQGQTASQSAARQITVSTATAADQAGIARQKVCPVTGGKLGGMGAPVKLLVGDQPIYLCCRGCVRKVQENPERYLAKVAPPRRQR